MTDLDPAVFDLALRVVWEQHPDALFIAALDGHVLEANDALLARVGYSREELIELGLIPVVKENTDDFKTEELDAAIAGEQRRNRMTGVRSDGTTFRVEVITVPLEVDGEIVAVLGIARDLEELEGAEAERRAIEERFEATLNSISDGIYFLDRDFRFIYVNPRGEEISRRSRADLFGKSLWDEFPLMRGSEFGIGYQKALTEQTRVVVREAYSPFNAVLEATVYPSQSGIAIYVRDVTEEEHARSLLTERDRRIASQAALLDKTRDAMVVRGLDHTIQYWNRGAESMYGWSASEAIGQSIRELLYDQPEAFDAATEAVISLGEWTGDIEQRTRDGRTLVASCRWSLVLDEHGEPEAIFAVNSDVTERRRDDELASREQRMKSLGTLAGGIAHDLNNVLTPLLMSVQLLAMEETDASKLQTLNVIEGSVKRGAEMIRQVLSFARGVEGRRIPVHLSRLIDDLIAFCNETLPPSIVVTADVDPGIDTVGDPTQLLQVLNNLVTNARDVMPDGGGIHIVVGWEPPRPGAARRALISVTDTGPGIPPEIADHMFEPFFTTKDVGVGTGLGLAICASIVRSHGGEMRASSGPGKGATFELLLTGALHTTPESHHRSVAAPRGNGELVLIVDDEAAIRQTARKVLEASGYRTAVAAHGGEAVAYLERFPGTVALVITDVTMPVLDGIAAAQSIAEAHPGLPVLFMSGIATDGEYLAKPFSAVELLKAVAKKLEASAP